MNVSKLTVAQLKEELTKRDADLSGLKKDLMERLQTLIDAEGGGDEAPAEESEKLDAIPADGSVENNDKNDDEENGIDYDDEVVQPEGSETNNSIDDNIDDNNDDNNDMANSNIENDDVDGGDATSENKEDMEEVEEEKKDPSSTLFISRYDPSISDDDLKEYFSQYGEVVDMKRLKSFTFLELAEQDMAQAALASNTKMDLNSKKGLVVQIANRHISEVTDHPPRRPKRDHDNRRDRDRKGGNRKRGRDDRGGRGHGNDRFVRRRDSFDEINSRRRDRFDDRDRDRDYGRDRYDDRDRFDRDDRDRDYRRRDYGDRDRRSFGGERQHENKGNGTQEFHDISDLVQRRESYRAQGDFESADRIRDDLTARGVKLVDKHHKWFHKEKDMGARIPKVGRDDSYTREGRDSK